MHGFDRNMGEFPINAAVSRRRKMRKYNGNCDDAAYPKEKVPVESACSGGAVRRARL